MSGLRLLLDRLLSHIHINVVSVNCRFGFDDPCYTGMLSGYLYGLFSFIRSRCDRFSYYLDPQFFEAGGRGEIKGDVRFRVFPLLFSLFLFIANMAVLRLIWCMITIKRNKV